MRHCLPGLCLLLLIVMLGGCAQRETSVEEGIRTKTLLVGNQNEPATFDPHLCDSSTEVYIVTALFEGLTAFDEKTAAAVPGTAERWEVSPDGLVYTFHLRANAKWSNGDRVTARDFAWSFERFLSPGLASPYAYMLWPIRGAEAFTAGQAKDFSTVGIEALGDTTLRLTLAQPAPHILTILATAMPLHRASVEQAGGVGDRTSPWARPGKLVGNGAFTLAEWRPGAHVIAAKNPHYWGAATNRLERVKFLPIEKSDTEELNFRAGQLHVTFDVPPTKIPVYRAEAPGRLRLDPQLSTFYVNFNATKPPFTDARVRRAFALALDRAAIAATVFNGAREPARTLVPPNCGGYTGPAGQRDDFAAARELLAAAGFPGGKNFPALPMLVRNDAAMPKVAEVIQAMWRRELGVTITIEPSEQKTWIEAQNTLRHTIAIRGWTADFPDPTNFLDPFRAGVGGNSSGWASPAFDRLLDQAATALDPAARFALLRQAEALLLEDAGLAPLYHGARTYLIHPAVKNWEPAPMGIHRYQLIELRN
ncbi:MAG: peptide ABC transporter substrate-binding protein [Opitutaceae bacterium]|nr:peptide ABC transporter substrate-binding protein [Opitutaceae bacterium]